MRKTEMRLLTSICVIAVLNLMADLPVGDVAWLKEQTSNGVSGDVIVVPTGEYKLDDTLTNAAGVTIKSATGNPDNNMFLDGTPEAVGFAKTDPTIDYDYSLKKSSSLVDKGMALDWVVAKETLDVNCEKKKYRLEGKSIDIGAYEYHPYPGLYLIMR
ncbi:MAG: hypothetical protein J6V88_01105 [Kiritimatiellae bacterium]|nr:hypothetical protein [Kiritimatiellia bacterium]